jgi:ligand-binding SRPBCC domain-containing protein
MTTETELPHHSDHITIGRPPEAVYAMISDVTRMGEWSPVCRACWWDEGDSARVGAWFTGRNEQPDRTWETRCEVIAADPGREFTFVVGGTETPFARWSYTFAPVDGGTELTESWQVMPALLTRFAENFDDGGVAALAERTATAHSSMAATLAAIKDAAERS